LNETDSYRVVARLRGPGEPESRPFDQAAQSLTPQVKDLAYTGSIAAPQPAAEDPGSTLQKVVLDVAALDGDRVVARSSVDLQTIDDPAEFRDPRPDHGALAALAKNSGGRAITSANDLANLLGQHPDASVRVIVTRWPLWDNPLLWLLLLGLLASEWILRRRRGLA
jgi:hypothetical protein